MIRRKHLTLGHLTPDTRIRETDLLDWRLRFVFWKNGIETLRQLSEYKQVFFQGQFLCNEKAITNMTLFLNCVKLDWKE